MLKKSKKQEHINIRTRRFLRGCKLIYKSTGCLSGEKQRLQAYREGRIRYAFFILHYLQEELGVKLVAVHVNHGIRGEDADADERFVQNICETAGIPLELYAAIWN